MSILKSINGCVYGYGLGINEENLDLKMKLAFIKYYV